MLGAERVLVVHGSDGSDELTLSGESLVAEIRDGKLSCYHLAPEQVGLRRASARALQGGGAAENAALLLDMLGGRRGAYREATVFNAAAALYVGGLAEDLQEGAHLAEQALDSGAATAKLEALKIFTGRCKENAGTDRC